MHERNTFNLFCFFFLFVFSMFFFLFLFFHSNHVDRHHDEEKRWWFDHFSMIIRTTQTKKMVENRLSYVFYGEKFGDLNENKLISHNFTLNSFVFLCFLSFFSTFSCWKWIVWWKLSQTKEINWKFAKIVTIFVIPQN